MTVIVTKLTEVHRILLNFKKKTFGIHSFLCKMIVTHTSASLSSARWLITSWRPGLASSSGKGYSTDSDKDDKDMEGRVFERVFGQMSRNYDSTRRAAAAFFVLVMPKSYISCRR